MDKTIDDYSQSLVDLERQKQQLEQVMKKMGEEWEESGAGIGWLHSLQSPKIAIDHHHQQHRENQVDEVVEEEEESDLMALTSPLTPEEVKDRHLFQFFSHHHSPDYLDSLLTMNETLLAQSVNANTSSSSSPLSSTVTTPTINTTLSTLSSSMITPPITPDELDNQKQNQNNNNNHTNVYFHSK